MQIATQAWQLAIRVNLRATKEQRRLLEREELLLAGPTGRSPADFLQELHRFDAAIGTLPPPDLEGIASSFRGCILVPETTTAVRQLLSDLVDYANTVSPDACTTPASLELERRLVVLPSLLRHVSDDLVVLDLTTLIREVGSELEVPVLEVELLSCSVIGSFSISGRCAAHRHPDEVRGITSAPPIYVDSASHEPAGPPLPRRAP